MKRAFRFAIFLLLIGFGLALGFYFWHGPAISAHRLEMLSTWGLGSFLAEHCPGGRVLVLSNPFASKPGTTDDIRRQEASRVEGLLKGLGTAMTSVDVVYPELRPGAAENPRDFLPEVTTTTPLSFLMATNAMEDLLATHPETDLIISLIGVPLDLPQQLGSVADPDLRFAFLLPDLRLFGGEANVRQWLSSGKIAGFVVNQQGGRENPLDVEDMTQEEFRRFFVLVNEENVENALRDWGTWVTQ